MYVNTRNGLFANKGWGGGVFNYNVAFGAVENPSAVSGLGQDSGALMAYRDGSLGATQAELSFCNTLDPARQEICLEDLDNRPWMAQAAATLAQQQSMNNSLSRLGRCPLREDGILGPRTCGAMDFLSAAGEGHFSFTCEAHRSEGFIAPRSEPCAGQPAPQPAPAPTPEPEPEPEPLPSESSKQGNAGILMLGGALLLVAGLTAVVTSKDRRK